MKTRLLNWHWIVLAILVRGVFANAEEPANDPVAAQKDLAQTRLELQEQGFKTDLTNFDFSTSPELQAREAAIKATAPDRNTAPFFDHPSLMEPTGSNNVVIVWKQGLLRRQNASWPENSYDLTWEAFRQAVNQRQPQIDAACTAILSGPIEFNLKATNGNAMLLPHLALLKDLTQIFNDRAMLALHDGDRDAAWTNLLAATRLVTAWNPEPAEISHEVRFEDAKLVFGATWQVLQAGGWTDDQLARLQHEWETADFLGNLPEIQAFRCASDAAAFEHDKLMPQMPAGGQYEDEKNLLLFYHDREIEFRHAVQAGSWLQMRSVPGVTNGLFFRPKYRYRGIFTMSLSQRQMRRRFEETPDVLPRAAEAEAERRVLITALALERYFGKHAQYPETLPALAPEFVPSVPVDFINGQPLHYHVTNGGCFLLYSVGLDGVDNRGKVPAPPSNEESYGRLMNPNRPAPESDIVWPLPASPAQVAALRKRQADEFAEQMAAVQARGQAAEVEGEKLRQDTIQNWLVLKPPFITNEPIVEGKPLGRILQNTNTAGSAALSLDDLLSLKKITTGSEPDMATYELPISYDAIKGKGNLGEERGELRLLVDGKGGGEFQGCDRATNGDCLLIWNTTYDPPGQHALRADLFYYGRNPWQEMEFQGPVSPYYSSNVLQFFEGSSVFTDKGATFYAKTAEPHAVYDIQLKTPDGKLLKAFTGTTTNGVIDVDWDLRDEHGNKYTGQSIDATYNVTLPDSGRSQTVK